VEVISVACYQPERLDLYLVRKGISCSRSRIQQLIKEKEVQVNGQPTRPSYKVRAGDTIRVVIPRPTKLTLIPEEIPLDIVYEDETLLLVNKSAGMVVHPAPGNNLGTLVHALLHHCKDLGGIGGRERPGIVHRLDKETSGILVVAKTDSAHIHLSKQFKGHSIERRYFTIVLGRVNKEEGKIVLAIGRDRVNRKKISSRTDRPREATTRFIVIERFKGATGLAIIPETGRTHQIRVHLAHLGYPVVGDRVYGRKSDWMAERQMLHAGSLGFIHPETGKKMVFSVPPPQDMQEVMTQLRHMDTTK